MNERVVPFRTKEKLALYDAPTLVGEINSESSEILTQLIEHEAVDGGKTIDIVIKSRGGSSEETLLLLQDINRIRETYGVKIRALEKQDRPLSPREAMEANLIDRVIFF